MSDTRLEELKQRLGEGAESDAQEILKGMGLEVPPHWTASDLLMEACRRADCTKAIMGVPGFVDARKAERKWPEVVRHVREIAALLPPREEE